MPAHCDIVNMRSQLILGVRELPRPRGEGYLYYKLSPSDEDGFLTYLPLNDLSDKQFSDIVENAISKLKSRLEKKGVDEDCLQYIKFDNMQPWAQTLVNDLLANHG